MPKSHYDTLEIKDSAQPSEIKRAYWRLARKLHPDVNRNRDAATRMSEVNEAYAVLGDAERRAFYDAQRRTGFGHAARKQQHRGRVFVKHHLSIVDLPSPVYSLAFSPAKREIAIGCFDNTLRIASAITGKALAEMVLEGGAVSALSWVNRNRLVAAGSSERSVSVWRLAHRKVESSIQKRAEWVSHVAVYPNGKAVALGSVHRSVLVVDSLTGETVFQRRRHEDAISSLAVSPDSKFLASGGNDQRVVIYNALNGFEQMVLSFRAPIGSMAFDNRAEQIAIALIDNGIRIHDLSMGATKTSLWGHDKPVEGIAFHPCGWLLASVSRDKTIRLWDASAGVELEKLPGHSEPIRAIVFSTDGNYLVAGGLDRVVTVWRVAV